MFNFSLTALIERVLLCSPWTAVAAEYDCSVARSGSGDGMADLNIYLRAPVTTFRDSIASEIA